MSGNIPPAKTSAPQEQHIEPITYKPVPKPSVTEISKKQAKPTAGYVEINKDSPKLDPKKFLIQKNTPHAARLHGGGTNDLPTIHLKARTPEQIAREEKKQAEITKSLEKKVPWLKTLRAETEKMIAAEKAANPGKGVTGKDKE